MQVAAALATIGGQEGTPRCKVGRATTDIPGDACRVELRERKAPIGHERFVRGQEGVGLV